MHVDIIELGKLAGAISAIIVVLAWFSRLIKIELHPVKEIRGALKSSMQYSLIRAHEEYMRAGWISTHALKSLTDLHSEYKRFKNDDIYVDAIMGEIKKLPLIVAEFNRDNPNQTDGL